VFSRSTGCSWGYITLISNEIWKPGLVGVIGKKCFVTTLCINNNYTFWLLFHWTFFFLFTPSPIFTYSYFSSILGFWMISTPTTNYFNTNPWWCDARMQMKSLRWELKQKVDVVTTLEVDMNVLQEMLIKDLQMEQEFEMTKVPKKAFTFGRMNYSCRRSSWKLFR
jgi:hypothetical protein